MPKKFWMGLIIILVIYTLFSFKGIRHFWPKLKIIGEEETTPSSPWPFNPSELNPNLLLANHFANHNEIVIDDSVVWIDPLDGTLSFLKNELDCVTTLIGH